MAAPGAAVGSAGPAVAERRGGPAGAQRPRAFACARPRRASRPSRRSYLDTIEQAVSEGQTLLIEDIGETVEPVLDHLLGRNTIKKGRSAHPVLGC